MARIVFADQTAAYDGADLARRPLGGTETSVIQLAEALGRRGHDVACHTRVAAPSRHAGVTWAPLADRPAPGADLLVAVQHPGLLGLAPRPRRRVLWLVWPPHALRRRHLLRLWWYRARPVLVSPSQAPGYPRGLPGRRPLLALPFGLPAAVRGQPPLAEAPPPRAIFASNPQRNLRWLLERWDRAILPAVPQAELHLYGIRDYAYRYGDAWAETEARLGQFLPVPLSEAGRRSLRPHPPAPREALWAAMRASRIVLYGGHRAESFCLAVAEAQALGVPAVVRPVTVLPERVRHEVTGFVVGDDDGFDRAAVRLLTDDALWRRQHEASLRLQQGWTWTAMAAAFEAAVLGPAGAAASRIMQ